jgi:hypothetical protein
MTRDEIPPRTLNVRPIPFSRLREHMLSLLPLLRTQRSSQATLPVILLERGLFWMGVWGFDVDLESGF